MVVAACIANGYVNRNILVNRYNLKPLQASILLREFLSHQSHNIRNDITNNGYTLIEHPKLATQP